MARRGIPASPTGWIVSLLVVIGVVVVFVRVHYSLTSQQVQQMVYTAIQREAPASFLVTGTLDLSASASMRSTTVFMPQVFAWKFGSTEVKVRVPGRVSYGIDVSKLKPNMTTLGKGDTVEVTIPDVAIYSVEPVLSQLEIETTRGWLRSDASTQELTQHTLGALGAALRQQGVEHLRDSVQPRLNTALALEKLLAPLLQSAGLRDVHFRFRIGSGVVSAEELKTLQGPASVRTR